MTKKVAWAGLRSDQLGISREPGFTSKRRVPYYVPRVGESLQWNAESHHLSGRDLSGRDPSGRDPSGLDLQERARKLTVASTARPVSKAEGKSAISVPVIAGPKGRKVTRTEDKSDAVDSKTQATPAADSSSNAIARAASERPADRSSTAATRAAQTGEAPLALPPPRQAPGAQDSQAARPVEADVPEGVKHVLKRKAGMNLARRHSRLRSSEYQHRFGGGTSADRAPAALAEQIRKTNAVISKQKPPKEDRPPPPGDEEHLAETTQQRDAVQTRKLKSEYMENFRAPCHYRFGAGGWVGIRSQHPGAEQSRGGGWMAEVCDLREKAESYKRRLLGTHFSREHLNQILSDQNECWDQESSRSEATENFSSAIEALDLARVRDKQRVWTQRPREEGSGAIGAARGRQPRQDRVDNSKAEVDDVDGAAHAATKTAGGPPAESTVAWEEDASAGAAVPRESREQAEERALPYAAEEEDEDGTREGTSAARVEPEPSDDQGGRFPTPRLTALGGAQRTHHDLTTPAVGGALLVSPPKERPASQRREAPLGKSFSPHKYRDTASIAAPRAQSAGCPPDLLPCAGARTFDPLPLREELWGCSPARERLSCSAPARVLPAADERLALLSARSEASSTAASQLLERATQRRRDAWSKKTPG